MSSPEPDPDRRFAEGIASHDEQYAAFEKANPGVTYATWLWQEQAKRVLAGNPHPTIGPRLAGDETWDRAGEPQFRTYQRMLGLTPAARVVDYGCGTLRIGVHLIRHLEHGHYLGLDPNPDFVAMAGEMAGPLLEEKGARVEVAEESAIGEAVDFAPDVVFSTAVAFHIHPDDVGDYLRTLARLAHRPGARLVFDAKVSERPFRYAPSGWAWPLEFFEAQLAPLEHVAFHGAKPYYDFSCSVGHLEFRRPEG